jgi:TolA-binding protein
MTHGPPDTTNEPLAAEDLLVIERRRSLTEHEQRRLNMCLAASEPLQWLRQLGRDFDADVTDRDDDATITQLCVDAARKRFSNQRVGLRPLRAGIRVGAALVTMLLLSISAAAAWYRWSTSSAAVRSSAGVSAASPTPEPTGAPGHRSGQGSRAPALVTTDASCVEPVAALSASPIGPAGVRLAAARERPEPGLTTPAEPKSASELFSDANAARRSGDTDRAVLAYRRLQTEHPRSDEALLSHMLLARLELGRGAAGAALRQFDAYLSQASNGSLAQEALQGKAQALTQLGRKQEAAVAWRQLLQRYPTSVYAESAREHLGEGSR